MSTPTPESPDLTLELVRTRIKAAADQVLADWPEQPPRNTPELRQALEESLARLLMDLLPRPLPDNVASYERHGTRHFVCFPNDPGGPG